MPSYVTIPGPFSISSAPPGPMIHWIVGPVAWKEQKRMPIEVNLSTEQRVLLTIAPQTPGGDPAPVDGVPVWEVTSGACTLEAPTPANPLQTWVNGITAGDSVITVTADADMGAGVVHISDTCLAHVADPQAASLGMTAGTPELKP